MQSYSSSSSLSFPVFFSLGWKKKWDEIKVKANYDVTLEKAKKCYWCCVWNTYRLLQWSIPSCSQSTHMAKYSNFQYCEKKMVSPGHSVMKISFFNFQIFLFEITSLQELLALLTFFFYKCALRTIWE